MTRRTALTLLISTASASLMAACSSPLQRSRPASLRQQRRRRNQPRPHRPARSPPPLQLRPRRSRRPPQHGPRRSQRPPRRQMRRRSRSPAERSARLFRRICRMSIRITTHRAPTTRCGSPSIGSSTWTKSSSRSRCWPKAGMSHPTTSRSRSSAQGRAVLTPVVS